MGWTQGKIGAIGLTVSPSAIFEIPQISFSRQFRALLGKKKEQLHGI